MTEAQTASAIGAMMVVVVVVGSRATRVRQAGAGEEEEEVDIAARGETGMVGVLEAGAAADVTAAASSTTNETAERGEGGGAGKKTGGAAGEAGSNAGEGMAGGVMVTSEITIGEAITGRRGEGGEGEEGAGVAGVEGTLVMVAAEGSEVLDAGREGQMIYLDRGRHSRGVVVKMLRHGGAGEGAGVVGRT